MKPKTKWRFAIGTTSRVPGSEPRANQHYLVCDFDHKRVPIISDQIFSSIYLPTKRGWHLYTSYKAPFETILLQCKWMGADPKWLSIGRMRGYLFLADYWPYPFYPSWPVERMTLRLKNDQ